MIKIGKVIPSTDESLMQGRKLYIEAKCWECHGNSGRGDGPAAKDQKNDKGDPLLTTDLTNLEAFKTGYSPRVIYRTLTTGLGGASMPSFSATVSAENLWHLANYISSLAQSSDSQVLP